MTFVPGSFNHYLRMSGGFVTTLAQAVARADGVNKERLRLAFPQVVAAWEMQDWDKAPDAFLPMYNDWTLVVRDKQ